jgi:hypothetical protein
MVAAAVKASERTKNDLTEAIRKPRVQPLAHLGPVDSAAVQEVATGTNSLDAFDKHARGAIEAAGDEATAKRLHRMARRQQAPWFVEVHSL